MARVPGGPSEWGDGGRTWLGALGALVVVAALSRTAGPVGLLAGAAVAVLWYLAPGAYVVAVGHVVSLPLLADLGLGGLVVLEAGFVAIVAAPLARNRAWPVGVAAVAAASIGLGGVAWFGWDTWEPRWLAALAVVGLVAVGLYALHRYAVVRLELRGVERRA